MMGLLVIRFKHHRSAEAFEVLHDAAQVYEVTLLHCDLRLFAEL